MKYFKKFLDVFSYFLFFAMIGYIWEIIYRFLKMHTFVNRGMMHGPWLPLYGYGGLIIILILKNIKKKEPIRLFLSISITCTILEYFASWLLEVTNGTRWWNYRNYFLNINGRVCLQSFIFFGILGLLVSYYVIPPISKLKEKYSNKYFYIIMSILAIIFFTDCIYSVKKPNTGVGITFSTRTVSDAEYEIDRDKILTNINYILETGDIEEYKNNDYYREILTMEGNTTETLLVIFDKEEISEESKYVIILLLQDINNCHINSYEDSKDFYNKWQNNECLNN